MDCHKETWWWNEEVAEAVREKRWDAGMVMSLVQGAGLILFAFCIEFV